MPPNAAATVRVRARGGAAAVEEGGGPAARAAGVVFVGVEGDDTLWDVASGTYAFAVAGG